jgi:hypothetical protein
MLEDNYFPISRLKHWTTLIIADSTQVMNHALREYLFHNLDQVDLFEAFDRSLTVWYARVHCWNTESI